MLPFEVEVVIWEPVGVGGSSFGHISVIIRGPGDVGTSYSLSGAGCDVRSAKDYLARNEYREGTGLLLALDPKQTTTVVNYFRYRMQCEYTYITFSPAAVNNCASPIQRALALAGVKLSGFSLMPKALGINLYNHGLVKAVRRYFGQHLVAHHWHMPWSLDSGGYPWRRGSASPAASQGGADVSAMPRS